MSLRRTITLVATALVALAAAAAASADQSYTDARGDAGVGSDITNVTVRNTQDGLISIQVGLANPVVANHVVSVYVDADRNPGTGSYGYEYWMYGGPLLGVGFFAWNGSDFVPVSAPGFAVGGAATTVMEFRFHRSAIGNVSTFDFAVWSASLDEGGGGLDVKVWDAAPDVGSYRYALAFPRCSNGLDDDGDGLVDYPSDPGCSSPADDDERNAAPPRSPGSPSTPSAATFSDAPSLPARVRFTGASIKHVRLGEKLYRTMKAIGIPRVVSIACWSKADWGSVLESAGGRQEPGIVTAAFWRRDQPRWLHISPTQCRDLQALMDTRAVNARRAAALVTVLHERVHAQGIADEAQTNCYAVQLVDVFARELNFVPRKRLSLERLAVRRTRAFAPRGYWNAARCRDGGRWDLAPGVRNLDY